MMISRDTMSGSGAEPKAQDTQALSEARTVERALLKLEGNELQEGESECAVLLEVQDVGSWIIKIRKNGIIVNNKALIFSECVVTSAQIVFTSTNVFWSVMNGGADFHDETMKNTVSSSGSDRAIETCMRKLVRSYKLQLSPATDRNSLRFRLGLVKSPKGEILSVNGAALSQKNGPARRPAPQVMKQGWLLKKGAIISGWRSRYFVVYPGRVEYFLDKNDAQPRGAISLLGAQIYPAKKSSVNGVSGHWGWIVEPHARYKEKTFRLASELSGDEGQADAHTWVKAFELAASRQQTVLVPKNATTVAARGLNALVNSVKESAHFPTDLTNGRWGWSDLLRWWQELDILDYLFTFMKVSVLSLLLLWVMNMVIDLETQLNGPSAKVFVFTSLYVAIYSIFFLKNSN